MAANNYFSKIDLLILCGGTGTRLQSLAMDRPKPMVDINGRPFLDILIDHLMKFSISRIIFCLGFRGDIIKRYYTDNSCPFDAVFSQESRPMGTAGAIKNAQNLVKSDPFIVVNGDSFCPIDLNELITFHNRKNAEYTIALTSAASGADYGTVLLNGSLKVRSFNEKSAISDGGLVNAGIYLLGKKVFNLIEANKRSSLEYDIFPAIVGERFYGYATDKELTDIGTPERYEIAKRRLK